MPPLMPGSTALHQQPGIRDYIGTYLGGRESYYSRMCNVRTTNRAYEDAAAVVGLPIATEKPIGQDIQSQDPVEGTTKRTTPTTFGIGFEVPEEVWEDDLAVGNGSMIRDSAENMGDSLAERVELEAHRMFNTEGFDGTYTVLPSGTDAFFATSHAPIVGAQGITQANRPSTNADLNVTSLRLAFTTMKRWRNDQGMRIPRAFTAKELIVPPESEYLALELLRSSDRPDTANRVENVTKNMVSVLCNAYLDDTDSWFVRGSKHFANFDWRFRPRLDSFDDRKARVAIHVIYGRFVPYPLHWLGYYGSPGE